MLFNFFNKNQPEFWKNYVSKFDQKKESAIENVRFVVFDTETTGLNIKSDRILSIGAIGVVGNRIEVAKSLEMYLNQEKFDAETVKIHGILKQGNLEKVSEEEAVIAFLEFVGDAVLVAHHVDFDITIFNQALKRMGLPKLLNKKVDTGVLYKKTLSISRDNQHFGLDELCKVYNISKHDRHTALGDAYIAALVFLKVISALKKSIPVISLHDLYLERKRDGLL